MTYFTARFRRHLFVLTALLVHFFAGAVVAQTAALPTCASVMDEQSYAEQFGPVDYETQRAECAINWVQDGRLLTMYWTVTDLGVMNHWELPDGTQVLGSSRQPRLIDIDQDGWLDVAAFSLIGMVNGDYDFYRYNPEADRFDFFGEMNGAHFVRHPGGYIVAVGRSSAAASGMDVFKLTTNGIVREASIYVDAGLETGPNGAPECRVTVAGQEYTNPDVAQIARIFPADPALILEYCNYYTEVPRYYDDVPRTGTNLIDVAADPVIVPDGTVFYCQLQGTAKAVTVVRNDAGFSYAFGPVDGPPELALDRPASQVRVLPENAAGPSRFGEIGFQNGDFEYIVSYGFELFDDAGNLRDPDETFQRMLVVIKDGDYAKPVFERTCDPDLSHDSIALLPRS